MIPVSTIVDLALSQDGDRYIFGAEASPSDTDPDAFDCSELVQWACARANLDPTMPDGSWIQWRHCRNHDTLADVAEAVTIRGALLFKFTGGDPATGGRPSGAHVAISLGNGQTIEARSSRHGVGIFTAANRGWTHAALIPGAIYQEDPMQIETIRRDVLDPRVEPIKWHLFDIFGGVRNPNVNAATNLATLDGKVGTNPRMFEEADAVAIGELLGIEPPLTLWPYGWEQSELAMLATLARLEREPI